MRGSVRVHVMLNNAANLLGKKSPFLLLCFFLFFACAAKQKTRKEKLNFNKEECLIVYSRYNGDNLWWMKMSKTGIVGDWLDVANYGEDYRGEINRVKVDFQINANSIDGHYDRRAYSLFFERNDQRAIIRNSIHEGNTPFVIEVTKDSLRKGGLLLTKKIERTYSDSANRYFMEFHNCDMPIFIEKPEALAVYYLSSISKQDL